MGDADQHIPELPDAKHVCVGSAEGGACLFHNEAKYKQKSCSYRWQGTQENRDDHKAIYKNHPLAHEKANLAKRGITRDHVVTMQRTTKSGESKFPLPRDYDERLELPTEAEDWALGGPKRKRPSPAVSPSTKKLTIPIGQNFVTAFWPYWNNAHHLIPKAHFGARLMQIADNDIRELVAVGLYRVKYNINHFYNVVFLPMDQEVGMMLNLPRHITMDGDAEVVTEGRYADHEAYTAQVDIGLGKAIRGFELEADQARASAKKQCEALKTFQVGKEQLERVSEKCFKRIVKLGKKSPGASLDDIGAIPFK